MCNKTNMQNYVYLSFRYKYLAEKILNTFLSHIFFEFHINKLNYFYFTGLRRSDLQVDAGISSELSIQCSNGTLCNIMFSPKCGQRRQYLSRYPER